jgi:hypothetical protein
MGSGGRGRRGGGEEVVLHGGVELLAGVGEGGEVGGAEVVFRKGYLK